MTEFRDRLRWFYSPPIGADRRARWKWFFEYLGFIFTVPFVLAGLAYYFPGSVAAVCGIAFAVVVVIAVVLFIAAYLA